MIPTIITCRDSKSCLDKAYEIAGKENIKENSPDFILISPQNSIGIGELREIIPVINLKPYQSPKKIVVVSDAQKMTIEAQNSFLKTLEEPPPNTIILLLAESEDQLLPTITSRCKIIKISQADNRNKQEAGEDIDKIIGLPLGLKFKKAQEISSSKEEAIKWINDVVLELRAKMLKNIDNNEATDREAELIKRFQKAKDKIEKNTSIRLVIENLLASI